MKTLDLECDKKGKRIFIIFPLNILIYYLDMLKINNKIKGVS